ncbi:hypothetical protein J6590_024941 [Homalodisca vitripennis]|nr:hypothetical protein J6590_024941 [Homalodisca vitripennis]
MTAPLSDNGILSTQPVPLHPKGSHLGLSLGQHITSVDSTDDNVSLKRISLRVPLRTPPGAVQPEMTGDND